MQQQAGNKRFVTPVAAVSQHIVDSPVLSGRQAVERVMHPARLRGNRYGNR
jgi:hypothetical protein